LASCFFVGGGRNAFGSALGALLSIGERLGSATGVTTGASASGDGAVDTGFGVGGANNFGGALGAIATTFGRGKASGVWISGAGIEISWRGPGRSFGPATIVCFDFSCALGSRDFFVSPGLMSGSLSLM